MSKIEKKSPGTQDNVYHLVEQGFRKDNGLINSKMKLSSNARKVLNMGLHALYHNNFTKSEGGSSVVTFKTTEINRAINKSDKPNGSFYETLKRSAKSLQEITLCYVNTETKSFDYMNLLSRATYERGEFKLYFNGEIKDFYEKHKAESFFTVLNLEIQLSWQGAYTDTIYEKLLSKCFGSNNNRYQIEYNEIEFKFDMGIYPSDHEQIKPLFTNTLRPDYEAAEKLIREGKIKNYDEKKDKLIQVNAREYHDIWQHVIQPAIAEINANPASDIYIDEYSTSGSGLGGKTDKLIFKITRGRDNFKINKKNNDILDIDFDEDEAVLESNPVTVDENELDDLIDEVKDIFGSKYKIKTSECKTLLAQAGYDIERIRRACEYVNSSRTNVDSYMGYIRSAISNNWFREAKNVEKKTGPSWNNGDLLNSYSDEDINEIEKELLKH